MVEAKNLRLEILLTLQSLVSSQKGASPLVFYTMFPFLRDKDSF